MYIQYMYYMHIHASVALKCTHSNSSLVPRPPPRSYLVAKEENLSTAAR